MIRILYLILHGWAKMNRIYASTGKKLKNCMKYNFLMLDIRQSRKIICERCVTKKVSLIVGSDNGLPGSSICRGLRQSLDISLNWGGGAPTLEDSVAKFYKAQYQKGELHRQWALESCRNTLQRLSWILKEHTDVIKPSKAVERISRTERAISGENTG